MAAAESGVNEIKEHKGEIPAVPSVPIGLKSHWDTIPTPPKIMSLKRVCAVLGFCTGVAPMLEKHLQTTFMVSYDQIEIVETELGTLHAAISKWYAEWLTLLAPSKTLMSWIESKSSKTLHDLLKEIGLGEISREDVGQLASYLGVTLESRTREKVAVAPGGVQTEDVLYQSDELLAVVSYTRDWNEAREKKVAAQAAAAAHKRWFDAEQKQAKVDSAFMEQFVEPATKQLMDARAIMWKWWAADKTALPRPFLAEAESDKPVPALDLGKYIPGATFDRTLDWSPMHAHTGFLSHAHIFQLENKSFLVFPDSSTSGADAILKMSSIATTKKADSDLMMVTDLTQKIRSGRIYATWEDVLTAKREARESFTYELTTKLKRMNFTTLVSLG
ncbi:MAG: hypothetical protein Hyperionvirus28_3 [Hyperionvirus sp.]|uniref:Uncharacterized protein n=1 Tax=Hyperionvirus sp. TaxID=2487770 RepID=A0A3G5ABA2_9VIRU|nr:MAG: hypothetical protein Hyperionvirus28_3 [Hyperionvirus sp.]